MCGRKMEAYCVKCRSKKEMKNAKAITMKNGKPTTQGVCGADYLKQNLTLSGFVYFIFASKTVG